MSQFFTTFEYLQSPVWVFDIENKAIIWANSAALPLWEAESLSELRSRDLGQDMSDAVEATLNDYLQMFKRGESLKLWWSYSPKSKVKNALCHFSGIPSEDGRIAMLVHVISEEASLRRELAFSDGSNLALLFSSEGQLLSANRAFIHAFGEQLDSLATFVGDIKLAEKWLHDASEGQVVNHRKLCWTGRNYDWFSIDGKWLADKQQLLLSLVNISQEKEQLKQAKYQSEHDYLTGLLNRRGMITAIHASQHSSQPYTLLFLDVDGFKLINDTYGHAIGDKMLRAIAIRLSEIVKFNGLLARFGGDEFIIQIDHRQVEDPAQFARKLITNLNKPFHLKEVGELSIGCSIGMASFPNDAKKIETLITQADMAMHRAKLRGRNRCHHFSPEMAEDLYRKMTLRHHLTLAMDAEAFELYYQPIVDLKNNRLGGFEALIRWYDEDLGQVAPSEFIPLAEETGQIVPLGKWTLKQACMQLSHWNKTYGKRFTVSVNLSRAQLHASLATYIGTLLEHYDINASQLALELTESAMLQEYDDAKQCLVDLAELGIELHLDDFGTGYSSLSQLQNLPITMVKLDQSFVQANNQSSRAIVEATCAICDKLNLKLVAEGVETPEQLEYIQQCEFDYCQGYYLGKPMPAHELEQRQFNLFNIIPKAS
ncbi:EAL domain-containing protein [Photobacterium sp. CAU 1568]|uniref:EAL domain-containing protein n=1 Tax=Photobacterium arenosum TaxID=2774143 RepID=A0ABR9BJ91_9GAMM|nr:EAL domain-containing protein [Photobacterium arenosum]MBD8512532.1 EAL domain-containing protein [Photobacterium arenosum]